MDAMTDREQQGPPGNKAGTGEQDARTARMGAALRENLARRKAQSRARAAADGAGPTMPASEKD